MHKAPQALQQRNQALGPPSDIKRFYCLSDIHNDKPSHKTKSQEKNYTVK